MNAVGAASPARKLKILISPLNKSEPRIFDLSEVRKVRLTALTFTPDPRFKPGDPRYKRGIICSI
jgi:hypothetical protein